MDQAIRSSVRPLQQGTRCASAKDGLVKEFSGVEFETGLIAARELAASLPEGVSLPVATLAWIASRPGVTTVIPGARSTAQAEGNAAAGALLDRGAGIDLDAFDAAVHDVYDRMLRAEIHPQW